MYYNAFEFTKVIIAYAILLAFYEHLKTAFPMTVLNTLLILGGGLSFLSL